MRSVFRALLITIVSSTAVFGDFTAGGNRPVVVREPSHLPPDIPRPLLILLHGYTSNGAGQESYWRARVAADELGLLLAYPDGTQEPSGTRFWNATDACCNFRSSGVDDSAYLRSLIDEIATKTNVDPDRIFFAGLSNGGFMSHRMACDHADKVAAIASQAGATFLDANDCRPSAPVHILQIHGTSDATIPYGGGRFQSGARHPGARETVSQWAQANGCAGEPEPLDLALDIDTGRPGAETSVLRYSGCPDSGSVELWTIDGGSHVPSLTANGQSTNLAVLVMDWLLAHPKRPPPEASFTIEPDRGAAPLEVAVSAAASTSPSGTTIARYHWDFGDGTTAEGDVATHTYREPGIYQLSLIVVSDDGRVSARAARSVVVTCAVGDTAPWVSSDIGDPTFPGSAFPEATENGDGIRICAAGSGVASAGDELVFLHQALEGDFRLTARVPDIAGHGRAVAGVMARQGLEPGDPFMAAFLELGAQNRFRFRYRDAVDGRARSDAGEEFDTGGWVRVERRGDVFSGASSLDGESWTAFDDQVITGAPEMMLAGIAVASKDPLGQPAQILVTDIEVTPAGGAPVFVRGDTNGDGEINIADASHLLNWLFAGGVELPCQASGNANADGLVDIADASFLLNFLFSGGGAPPAPFPDCGPGASEADERLGCAAPPSCR